MFEPARAERRAQLGRRRQRAARRGGGPCGHGARAERDIRRREGWRGGAWRIVAVAVIVAVAIAVAVAVAVAVVVVAAVVIAVAVAVAVASAARRSSIAASQHRTVVMELSSAAVPSAAPLPTGPPPVIVLPLWLYCICIDERSSSESRRREHASPSPPVSLPASWCFDLLWHSASERSRTTSIGVGVPYRPKTSPAACEPVGETATAGRGGDSDTTNDWSTRSCCRRTSSKAVSWECSSLCADERARRGMRAPT